jgi:hypothetical protein
MGNTRQLVACCQSGSYQVRLAGGHEGQKRNRGPPDLAAQAAAKRQGRACLLMDLHDQKARLCWVPIAVKRGYGASPDRMHLPSRQSLLQTRQAGGIDIKGDRAP